MIDSRFENIENNIKIVGYLSRLSNSDDAESLIKMMIKFLQLDFLLSLKTN